MATSQGEVQHHVPFSTSDPGAIADAQAAHAAGETAAQARHDHLMANVSAGHAGDLMPSPSTQQPSGEPVPPDRGAT